MTADDAATLEQIARTDRDIGIRRIALEKITTPEVLAELAAAESERSLRDLASARAAELWSSRASSSNADEAGAALTGIIKLGDQRALVDVVVKAALPATRKRAFGELRDPRALAELAKSEAAQDLRTAAIARIDDGDVLRALAIDTTTKEVGLAAVEKLDDIDRLENVAQKAKNKAVRQKARKIVTEIQAAERLKKTPSVPDDVKRRRAEKAQLIREMEGVADSFDFAKVSEQVSAAEVAWMKLGGADDGDERFTKAVERFWKRKDIYEQQARSSDELRAVEREAQRERERAAAERAAKAAPAPAAEPAPVVDDAEAKARREERERQRAEEDAKRAAQAAEREARQKEEAERGAAIAASLEAMVGEMEQLAAADSKDGKAIDRLLQQAGKSFDQIGKVPGAQRDAIADRYRSARGKLVIRQNDLREAEDWERWNNVPKAEALIQTAKEWLEAPVTPDLGNRLRQLQALWKEVGPMPQKRSKELWEQFKALCDQVYDKVKGVRAVEAEKFAEVIKVKEALIAEAESLVGAEDLGPTAEKFKQLQAQWKASGHLPRKQGDELWTRFRSACDKFFERRKPAVDARHQEEAQNLAKKKALIARAQSIANAAGEGTWGKAIGEIKDLQREWKEIGYVARRDADVVWSEFRRACDALFTKRDAARDAEANAQRAEIDGIKAEIDAVAAGGDDAVTRAIAVRAKARELGVLGGEVVAMIRQVIAAQPDAVKGTELDPMQLRSKREKLIARAEELLPRQAPVVEGGQDVATQLKQAMRQNAFGDLRFSGRDPIEVIDELRTSWIEAGPLLDDADRAQSERFDQVVHRVLEASGAQARVERQERGDRTQRDERGRKRRDRRSGEHAIIQGGAETKDPSSDPHERGNDAARTAAAHPHAHAQVVPARDVSIVPDGAASATSEITEPAESMSTAVHGIPQSAHDAVTRPAHLPPEEPIGEEPKAAAAPPRSRPQTVPPPMPADELDGGWDLGDEDPTASASTQEEPQSTPSSGEMAGDGSVEGDGLDQVD